MRTRTVVSAYNLGFVLSKIQREERVAFAFALSTRTS